MRIEAPTEPTQKQKTWIVVVIVAIGIMMLSQLIDKYENAPARVAARATASAAKAAESAAYWASPDGVKRRAEITAEEIADKEKAAEFNARIEEREQERYNRAREQQEYNTLEAYRRELQYQNSK